MVVSPDEYGCSGHARGNFAMKLSIASFEPAQLLTPLRIGLGALMLAAGVGKALDLGGFAAVIATYKLGIAPSWLWPTALGVSLLEAGFGVWLLANRHLRAAAFATLALNFGYAVTLLDTLLRGITLTNCGCFGVFFPRPLTWLSPVEELLIVGAAWAVARFARR